MHEVASRGQGVLGVSSSPLRPFLGDVGGERLQGSLRGLCASSNSDLSRRRSVAQHPGRLVIVTGRGADVDAQHDLPPAVQHVPEEVRDLCPRPGCQYLAGRRRPRVSDGAWTFPHGHTI